MGSSNSFSGVTDTISSALGTDGGGGGVLGGLSQLDKAVNQIPGGWITVGGLAAGGAALAYAPEVMALAESAGITPAAASETLGIPAIDATTGEAVSSGYGLNAGAPAVGAYSPSGAAATQSALGLGSAPTGLELSSVGMGGTTGAGSLSGIVGSEAAAGLGGANLGYGLTPSQLAKYEAANPSVDTNNLSKLLKQGAASGLSNSLGKLAQGIQGTATTNAVRGNQNPFTYTTQQPIQNAQPMDLSALSKLLKQG